MAGPLDIQRLPRGLLDLLGLLSGGDTPHQFANTTTGVLDLLDLYTVDRLQVLSALITVPPAALGNFQFAGSVVPQGQVWLVKEMTVNNGGVVAAAASIDWSPVIFRNQSLVGNGTIQSRVISSGAGTNYGAGAVYEKPNLVLPGQSFGVQVHAITGAPAVPFQLTLWYASLRI